LSKKEGSTRRFFGIITYRLRFSTWLWLRFCAWLYRLRAWCWLRLCTWLWLRFCTWLWLRFCAWLWLRFCAWLWLWFRARLRARRKTFMMCFSRICLTISTISSSLCFSSFSS